VFIQALPQWIDRGLIDRFMVCLHDGTRRVADPDICLTPYADAVRDTEVEFWLDMYQGRWFEGGGPTSSAAGGDSLNAPRGYFRTAETSAIGLLGGQAYRMPTPRPTGRQLQQQRPEHAVGVSQQQHAGQPQQQHWRASPEHRAMA
jgi:hypothetical protein